MPFVPHVHGAHVHPESDGYPEAWSLPDAADIPSGYHRVGSRYEQFMKSSPVGKRWHAGASVYRYTNDQRSTTLWYHDHTLGMCVRRTPPRGVG